MSKLTQEQIDTFNDNLKQFTGTEMWFRHPLVQDILYTQGVQYVAETLGAYWLVDMVAISQLVKAVRAESFQVWTIKLVNGSDPIITCQDGNYHTVYQSRIQYSDFPLPEFTLWFTDNVILLPSEY